MLEELLSAATPLRLLRMRQSLIDGLGGRPLKLALAFAPKDPPLQRDRRPAWTVTRKRQKEPGDYKRLSTPVRHYGRSIKALDSCRQLRSAL